MNRVTKRTWLMGVFILVLLGGMVFFLWEYAARAGEWVVFSGSPHVYNGSNIGCGTIVDRGGTMLLDITEKRAYAQNETTRKSTLHWLGDRKGYIRADAVSAYAAQMAGFDLLDGVYGASGTGGEAELTLSARVQNTALEAMAGRKGTVAVYNYKTGEILCAVTTPTFDPDNVPDIASDTTGKWDGVYLNRFQQSVYIPGSIFKVVTTGAALDCVPGIYDESFLCTGRIQYGEGEHVATVTCERAHGTMDLKSALANSCNCAFAQIAELVGRQNMEKYVEQFQVVEPLKFDGVTTARGNYNIEGAGAASFAWSCIGQHSNTINPARFMTFMGAIANGGQAMEPYLMAQVKNGEEITYQAEGKLSDRIMSKEVAETLKAYLRSNVKNIYGDWKFPGGLHVCGKSGTSQLGGGERSNAMFAGFVDDERYPLAFICVVENGGYGSATCIPVLSKVLSACMSAMDAA